MAKEIFVAYGVDVDAVAGWLGSYGGENSPDDISRGLFAGEVGTPRLLQLFERNDLKTTWFIPGHSIETFPRETEHGRRRRPRDRHPRLHAREPDRDDARAGDRRPRQVHRPRRARLRPAPDAATSRRGGSSRPSRTSSCSSAASSTTTRSCTTTSCRTTSASATRGRRSTTRSGPTSGWCRPGARRGDRPDRDPGQLVPRRPASDDVHQDGAEQPRLRQPAGHRAALDGPVRLGLRRARLRRLHDDHPSRRQRAPGRARDARADHRAHQRARRGALGDVRRDRRRLRAALAAQRPDRRAQACQRRARRPRRAPRPGRPAAARASSAPPGRRRRARPPRRGRGRRRGRTRARPAPRRSASRRRPRPPAETASRTPSTTWSFALPRPVPSSTIARAPDADRRAQEARVAARVQANQVDRSEPLRERQRRAARSAAGSHRLAVDVPDRPVAGRGEGPCGARVHLARLARSVDLAAEADECSQPGRLAGRSRPGRPRGGSEARRCRARRPRAGRR